MQGHRKVNFTNLHKVLYPSLGITKGQVIKYYLEVAPRMLAFLFDRPLTMHRFPDGIRKAGFYEKNAPKGKPYWVKTFRRFSEKAERDVEYVVCNDVETLAWLSNLAALEISAPLSKISSHEKPDLVFFDLDPEPPADFNDAIDVALILKEKLDLLGLKSYVKTSGRKGLHVVLPIVEKYTFKQTLAFVRQMGKFLAKESETVVSEFRQSKVPGTVFVDYAQNISFKTMICPYSLRAQKHAAVSTPLDWREVKRGLNPSELNIFSVVKREANPWKELLENKQTLDFEDALANGNGSKREQHFEDRGLESRREPPAALKEYARKRDFTLTSEPRGQTATGPDYIYVIQKHSARRLHHDLRLSREGVLKSWAVPKGVPEEPGTKRLAVQTEDHPIEYAEFEGVIPVGQYGAGTVELWDRGSYHPKIWTETKIEFFLRGKRLHGMYVLVRLKKTGSKRTAKNEWLLIKMKTS